MNDKRACDSTNNSSHGKWFVVICVILWLVVPVNAKLASSPWPMFHHDLNHTGLSPYYGPDMPVVKWTFSAGTGRGIISSATVGPDGTIYTGTNGWGWFTRSRLYAINPDGTEKWHWTPPFYSYKGLVDYIDTTPAIADDGTVYIGCWNRRFYALYPNGTLKWEFYDAQWKKSRGFVHTSPAIAPDGTIYVGNNNGKLYAINPDGTLKWSFQTGCAIQSSPAVSSDGTVYVGSYDRKLYAINPDGSLKWTYTIGMTKSSPAIGPDGTIYVGSYNGKLYAINTDGTLKWTYPTGCFIVSSPAIGPDGTIYVGSYDRKLYAINPDGTLKWTYTTAGYITTSPAIDAHGTVYVGSYNINGGYIYAINPDGSLLWQYNTGRICYSSPAITADGTLYIGTWSGKLYAFDVNYPPVLNPIGSKTVDEGITINIIITASDPDGDVLTFSSNVSFGTFTRINDTATSWSWTPSYDDAGTYYVDFDVSDGVLCDNETVQITVNDVNRPPVLELIGDKEINENETLMVDVNATDPDGDTLTYSCNRTDLFIDFNASTGIGHWFTDHDDAGIYYVDFGVSDGKGGFDNETVKITVEDVNRPPVLEPIVDLEVNESETVSIDVNATDPDGDALTYSCNRTDLFIDFNASTGIGHWFTDYDDAGTYYVGFGVSDGKGGLDNMTVKITVNDVNRPPVLEPIGDIEINESDTLTIDVNANDPDNDTLTYSCNRTDLFADFNPTIGVGDWITDYDDAGIYYVEFGVSDGKGGIDNETVKITVHNKNRPPVLDPIGDRTVNESELLEFSINASDPDGDILSYSATNLPDGASFDPLTRTFSWTPSFDQEGTYPDVHFEVSDGELVDYEDITIVVGGTNRPPVLDPIGDRTVNESELLEFSINASDPDGDILSYSATNLPDGASFDPLTRTFSWTPSFDQEGTYPDVHFEVSDGELVDYEDITIVVNDVNRPPELQPVEDVVINETETLTVDVNATDPDGDPLTFFCNRTDLFSDFSAETGIGHWITDYNDADTYFVGFGVSDGKGGIDNMTVKITVKDLNRPPELELITDREINEGEMLTVDVNATDPDGDALTYSCNRTDLFADFDPSTGIGHWITDYNDAGTYFVDFGVRDSKGGIDNRTIEITVKDVNQPPELATIGDIEINENESFEVALNATDPDGDMLTYSCNRTDLFADFNPSTGIGHWTPSYDAAGIYYVDFGVSDDRGGTDNETVRITVYDTNRAPVLGEIGDRTVNENSLLTFSISATDPDGDMLTYSASNLPTGATFDPGTGTFSWTPAFGQAGIYHDVHFEVTDGELADFENITITVRGAFVEIRVEPENVTVQPQDQFDVNITVDPHGNSVYAVQYYLHYNTSVIRAETQNKGPFLGSIGDTLVITNSIDHVTGVISYAETRKGNCGGVTEPGVLAVIHFTVIQHQGTNTSLNLSSVVAVDDNAARIESVAVNNCTVHVCENMPPIAIGRSMFRFNNVGTKYMSKTYFNASDSYDNDGNITYYRWAFGDGNYGTGRTIEHVYGSWKWNASTNSYEPFNVILTVEDNGVPTLDNSTSIPVNIYIAGDANGDGIVDIFDGVIVGLEWEHSASSNGSCYWYNNERGDRADLNNDGIVDIFDGVIVGANWEHVGW